MLRFSALLVWLHCLACVVCIPSPTKPSAPAIQQTELISLVINSQNTANIAPIKRLCESLLQTKNPKKRAINLFFTIQASTTDTEVEDYVYNFSWPYGKKIIRLKIVPIIGQINSAVESWYPAHSLNYGMFLSDNTEMSPLWLMWVDMIMADLKGNSGIFKSLSERLMGISLGSLKKNTNRIDYFYGKQKQFHLMQMPSLYTVLFFPQPWRELFTATRNAVAAASDIFNSTILSDEVHSGWNKYQYDYMRAEGRFICFPNFPDEKSFAAVQQGEPARFHPQLQYSSELAFL
jgi:hypothetical protein